MLSLDIYGLTGWHLTRIYGFCLAWISLHPACTLGGCLPPSLDSPLPASAGTCLLRLPPCCLLPGTMNKQVLGGSTPPFPYIDYHIFCLFCSGGFTGCQFLPPPCHPDSGWFNSSTASCSGCLLLGFWVFSGLLGLNWIFWVAMRSACQMDIWVSGFTIWVPPACLCFLPAVGY